MKRTAKKFESVIGVQIYSSKPLHVVELPNLVKNDPYVEDANKTALKDCGVVFYRNSDHANSAIACTSHKGATFYTQLYIDKKTGEVGQVFLLNVPRNVEFITDSVVKMVS